MIIADDVLARLEVISLRSLGPSELLGTPDGLALSAMQTSKVFGEYLATEGFEVDEADFACSEPEFTSEHGVFWMKWCPTSKTATLVGGARDGDVHALPDRPIGSLPRDVMAFESFDGVEITRIEYQRQGWNTEKRHWLYQMIPARKKEETK